MTATMLTADECRALAKEMEEVCVNHECNFSHPDWRYIEGLNALADYFEARTCIANPDAKPRRTPVDYKSLVMFFAGSTYGLASSFGWRGWRDALAWVGVFAAFAVTGCAARWAIDWCVRHARFPYRLRVVRRDDAA